MRKNLYFDGASDIELKKIGNIGYQQDGAIFGDYIFHFHMNGTCVVHSFPSTEFISSFTLGGGEIMTPHSNSVCFGCEFYEEGDEFPLLYSNVYNNYQKCEDRREGVCCVYRILRNGTNFTADLVQLIKIGFADNKKLWKSENVNNARPYGNFVCDNENSKLYAFVMRDGEHKTRFFKFTLPKLLEGVVTPECGVRVVTLSESDILEMFDCEYTNYMQGAVYYGGYIYSAEGFHIDTGVMPALKVFDVKQKKTVLNIDLTRLGMIKETEFIDVWDNKIYFGDRDGDFYEVIFKS